MNYIYSLFNKLYYYLLNLIFNFIHHEQKKKKKIMDAFIFKISVIKKCFLKRRYEHQFFWKRRKIKVYLSSKKS